MVHSYYKLNTENTWVKIINEISMDFVIFE